MRCKLCTLFCLIGVVCAAFALFQTGQSTAQTTHTITATAGTGGTITPSGAVTVAEGADQSFVITPDGTNSVAEVLVDGISQGPVSPYLFTNVTSDHYIEAIFNLSAECTDLSSVPLSAVKRAALPNIMFVLDDSGSMDWEFLTDEYSGKFQYHEYVFDNPGDNVFSGDILSGGDRKKWKSQWSGYNKLYYDPGVDYQPWPTLGDADLDTPQSHPMNGTPTFALNDTYYVFDFGIIVDNLDGAPSYVETGTWGESLYEPEYDGSGRWTDTVGSTATFTPDLLVADTYEVYAWWNCWTQRDTNVKITVTHQGGSDDIYRNQSADVDDVPVCYGPPGSPCCGQWVLIGTYSFAAGTAGSLTIERHAGSTGSSAVADAVKFVPTSYVPIDTKNAHYYTFVDSNGNGEYDGGEPVYLVVIEGTGGAYTIRYFEATVSGIEDYEEVILLAEVAEGSVPESLKSGRTAAEERQNFANWYSYYRRRELTATAAVANTIVNMEAVKVGFYSINQQLRQTVLPVKARGEDNTPDLLDGLYNLTLVGGT
jgi:type IV pilus assembly protein PilY1